MPSHAPYTVVVVDDTHDLRSLWKLMLERDAEFAVVGEAANGQAGAVAVARHQPDLVLLDIAMPVMDGLQALTLIRRASPHSAVVMLTSFSRDSSQAARAMALGAHGFIRKGLPRTELLGRLEEILDATGRTFDTASLC